MRQTCHMDYTDVLVLGAGLAGMRAAVAALEENPGLRVVVARNMEGPSGSSFANVNNTLGVQVPETEEERETFIQRVLEMGAPGYMDPALVSLLATEGVTRFNDLRRMGVPFRTDKTGGLQRLPGCFLPQAPTCYILNDIKAAHDAFAKRFSSLGGRYVSGVTVTDIVSDSISGAGNNHSPAPVLGVLTRPMRGGPALAIQAKAVVMAMGGPSPLFSRDISGPGNSGFAYALMARAGARLANTGYLQYIWHRTDNGRAFPMRSLAHPDVLVRTPKGDTIPIPESLRLLGPARGEHWPFGHGLPDAALDIFLADHLGQESSVPVRLPDGADGEWTHVVPMAHAGNGGAIIDEHGHTGVPGLYGCGECATGMHGTNRLGGAMVLATQVFGARAGRTAAREAVMKAATEVIPEIGPEFADQSDFMSLAVQALARHGETDRPRSHHYPWLKKGMQRHAILGGRPGLEEFQNKLERSLHRENNPLATLPLESALSIVTHLTGLKKKLSWAA
jgi:succinate dehydrogenase/fumarate reductase flavoprotein subunit